jgi:ABC-type nitrate/sulfonate/bicarbonate transport system ATPase subunit
MAETVHVNQVSKRFQQGGAELPVLHQIDLTIQRGEFVAILGPSGCGKSTLLRLIGGLDQPSSGEIRLGEQVVTQADPRCAVVFQEPRLFPWKRVTANVAVGSRRLKERPSTDAWLERVGLDGFGKSYPYQLSGGMAQRVALARALIGHPQVLLLDEPFASLDALTRLQMQDLLAGVCADLGATAVMVTHDVDEALHLADRIVVMSQRPSTVVEVIRVARPRPRERGDASLAPLRSAILRHFGFDLAAAACTESAPTLHAVAAD